MRPNFVHRTVENQLCMACTNWSDPVIRPVSVRFDKFTTRKVTNELTSYKKKKTVKIGLIIGD